MKNYSHIFRSLLVAVLSLQMISCGTLIYPERRGEKTGRLDVGVVVLDALGLLFGLIPGIIAFAVDFSTGAIYLPATPSARLNAGGKYRVVKFDPRHATKESLEALIRQETGQDFHFNDERIKYRKLKNINELSFQFAQFQTESRFELGSAANSESSHE